MLDTIQDGVNFWRGLDCNIYPGLYKSKLPSGEWKKYQDKPYSGTFTEQNNLLLILGMSSARLVAIDIDNKILAEQAKEKYKDLTLINQASRGCHLLFRILGELPKPKALKTKEGYTGELRSHGQYIVVAPSIHPDGTKYKIVSTTDKAKVVRPDELTEILVELGFDREDVQEDRVNHEQLAAKVPIGNRHDSAIKVAAYLYRHLKFSEHDLIFTMEEYNKRLAKYSQSKPLKEIYDICKYVVSNQPKGDKKC